MYTYNTKISTYLEDEREPFRGAIAALKEAVPIEQVAAEYTEMRPLAGGTRYVGRCPIPDHEDRTPSFTVYAGPDDGRFFCFGCRAHGDVIDLEELAGKHADLWTAVVALSIRYNVETPSCSEKWRRWQDKKFAITDLAANVRLQVWCRRHFKSLILNSPEITDIEDPAERREEIRRAWEAFNRGMRRIAR